MGELIVSRKSHYVNYFRKIRLYLDGKFVYAISDGETNRFELAPGTHTMEGKIDWCSSNIISFDIIEGQDLKVEIGSSAMSGFRGTVFPLLRFLLLIFSSCLSARYDNDLILWATLLLILSWYITEIKRKSGTSLVFYFTSGRNQFLYLKRID
jgi:hypothetical protein